MLCAEETAAPKVVFVNRFFHPDESATSQLLTDLALALRRGGVTVTVVSSRQAGTSDRALPRTGEVDGVEIRRISSLGGGGRSLASRFLQYLSFYPGALIALLRTVRAGDIIVAKTDPPVVAAVALIAARMKKAKLVNWIQDLYPEVAVALQTPMVTGPVAGLLTRIRNHALMGAEMNVVIGSTMAERLQRLGVPPHRISVIPNWADDLAIQPKPVSSSVSRRSWGLQNGDFVVGYSGNLGKAHEVETLVGAAKVLRAHKDIKFLFIGGGHQHARLRALIEAAELTSFVFRPHQPREQLADALVAADVHWVSLRPELEGLIVPSKLYGILAAGRPVLSVCSAEGEVSRVVREHDCGIVIEPGDSAGLARAVMSLRDDPELRASLGRRSRQASENVYSKQRLLKDWTNIISSLLPGESREAGGPRVGEEQVPDALVSKITCPS